MEATFFFSVWDLRFGVWGLGFQVQGSSCKVISEEKKQMEHGDSKELPEGSIPPFPTNLLRGQNQDVELCGCLNPKPYTLFCMRGIFSRVKKPCAARELRDISGPEGGHGPPCLGFRALGVGFKVRLRSKPKSLPSGT